MLEEISRREKEAGIYPEADVDAFMKVNNLLSSPQIFQCS
jgi:hypothetical protein